MQRICSGGLTAAFQAGSSETVSESTEIMDASLIGKAAADGCDGDFVVEELRARPGRRRMRAPGRRAEEHRSIRRFPPPAGNIQGYRRPQNNSSPLATPRAGAGHSNRAKTRNAFGGVC